MLEPLQDSNFIKCSNCAELIRRDAIVCRFCETGLSKTHFCSCPFCAESIRKDAAICRFCQSKLTKSDKPQEELTIRHYKASASASPQEDSTAKFSYNKELIREREKVIHEQLKQEYNLAQLIHITEDMQSQVRARIREIVNLDPAPLTMMEKGLLLQNILDEVFGFGPLGPLLRDPSVSDVCVNGINNVYVKRHGRLEKTNVYFENDGQLRQTIDKMIRLTGETLDDKLPILRGCLPDGWQITVTFPPVTIDGPTLFINRFSINFLSLTQIVEQGTMSTQMAEVLKACVKARINLIISGNSNSHATTLLNAFCSEIAPQERIITIEDHAQLRLPHDHWVRMETKLFGGVHELTQSLLIETAVAMRSDRIILGTANTSGALSMLQTINSGLSGCMTTIYGNAPHDCLKRLENMIMLYDKQLPTKTIRELIGSTLQIIVQVDQLEDGTRRITDVSEITGIENENIVLSRLFHLEKEGRDARGFFKCRHVGSDLKPKFLKQIEKASIPFKLEWLK